MSVYTLALILGLAGLAVAPPPNRQAASQQTSTAPPAAAADQQHGQQPAGEHPQQTEEKQLYKFAYSKYLEQVIKILESDPKFRERIKVMKEDDIKAGAIADQIEDLPQEVFDQLTQAKLKELERLREQIDADIKRTGDASQVEVPDHIDVYSWEKFHKEDLRKLITKTVGHMDAIDKKRREEFKDYEMKKKAEEDHKLARMQPQMRADEQHKIDEAKKRHNEHEKLKHPGGREQLEEVWEGSDHMEKDQFDPRTFFALHDLNGDGFWNDEELEALFQIELAKLYNDTNPDDDPREKVEEMYRMREHVTTQMDKNKDRLISLEEFLQDSEATVDDKKDEGWDDLAEQKLYTDEELKKFEEEYAKTQGWGDHPYEYEAAADYAAATLGNAAEVPPAQPHIAEQVQLLEPRRLQPIRDSNAINAPPPPPPQQHHQQPPQAQQPIVHEKKVDPVYGV